MRNFKHYSIRTLILGLSIGLMACQTGQPNVVQPTPSPSSSSGTKTTDTKTGDATDSNIFANALSKRSLSVDSFASGNNGEEAASVGAGTSTPQASADIAAPASAPIAPGGDARADASASIGIPYYGNGTFNQYRLKFVEELTFAAPQGKTLLTTYEQDIQPLIKEWDASARLLRSSASEGGEQFYLPSDAGKPTKLDVNFIFQWVSNEKKETLMFYALDQELRVHRMVWGEQDMDLSNVKIDTTQAQNIAIKAFQDRNENQDYTIYPRAQNQRNGIQIAYAIPSDAHWSFALNARKDTLRYFVSVNFKIENNNGEHYVGGFAEIDANTGNISQINRPTWYDRSFQRSDEDIDIPVADVETIEEKG